jgi:hypothetical protein
VFPSIAPYSDDNFYLVYQYDNQPGNAQQGDPPTAYGKNYISVMTVEKAEVWTSVEENNIPVYDYDVSQNYPNPFSGTSTVYVMLKEPAILSLEVHNLMGQLVYSIPEKKYNSGKVEFTIDGSRMESGIYFYSIISGESSVTKKMIIE